MPLFAQWSLLTPYSGSYSFFRCQGLFASCICRFCTSAQHHQMKRRNMHRPDSLCSTDRLSVHPRPKLSGGVYYFSHSSFSNRTPCFSSRAPNQNCTGAVAETVRLLQAVRYLQRRCMPKVTPWFCLRELNPRYRREKPGSFRSTKAAYLTQRSFFIDVYLKVGV